MQRRKRKNKLTMHVYHANELRRGNQIMAGGHEIYVNVSHKHSHRTNLQREREKKRTENSYNLIRIYFIHAP